MGMVGINVPIPAPLAYYYTFGAGSVPRSAIRTSTAQKALDSTLVQKTVTARWPQDDPSYQGFVMPTMC